MKLSLYLLAGFTCRCLLPGPERVWSGNALLSRYGIFSVPAKLLLLRLILEIKIAASQPVRSSERARSALEAAGTGWLDASGCPEDMLADSSLACSDGACAVPSVADLVD